MKLISWNVNGLRACVQKGFLEQFEKLDADFFCLQETKMQEGQLQLELPGYLQYWNCAQKKGYSGTAVFTKHVPLSVSYGVGVPELDTEGRLITLEYQEFYLVTCYTPNAQRELARIDHRMRWDDAFRAHIAKLDAHKPVIICGDLNVAHKEIDLKNPGPNRGSAGFSDQERDSFTRTLELGFTDTFRYLHPDAVGAYTWWSYMFKARQNNAGWRIDYFLVSDRLKETVYSAPIFNQILGSDHCPVGLELDISCNGSIWASKREKRTAETNAAEKGKTAEALKAAAKIGVLTLVTAGVLFGVAKFRPVASHGADAPQHTEGLPTETEGGTGQETQEAQELIRIVPCSEKMHTVSTSNSMVMVSNGDDTWVLDAYALPGSTNVNCWVRMELTDYGRSGKAGDFSAVNPEARFGKNGIWGTDISARGDGADWAISRYYEEGEWAGWFLYGYFPRNTLVHLTLGEQEYTVMAEPSFSAAYADTLETLELVDYAAHAGIFEAEDLTSNSGADLLAAYQKHKEENPALRELAKRQDAGETVAVFCSQNPDALGAELLRQVFPWEPQTDTAGFTPEELRGMSTMLLAWYALQDETLLQRLEETDSNVWNQLCAAHPLYAELQRRADLSIELLSYCKSYNGTVVQETAAALIDALMRCTGKVSASEQLQYEKYLANKGEYKMESVGESDAKQMATEELVSLIASSHLEPSAIYVCDSFLVNPRLSSSLSFSLPSSAAFLSSSTAWSINPEAYYGEFYEKYPAVRVLQGREDAVSCLMAYCDNAGTDVNGYARAWFFLNRVAYLKKMTVQEAKAFLGKYQISDPSKHTLFSLTRFVALKVMPIAMKQTEEYAGDPEEQYLKIRQLFPIVAELESRDIAGTELLSFAAGSTTLGREIRSCIVFLLERDAFRKQIIAEYESAYRGLLAEMITAEEAAQMETAELVAEVMNLTTLRKYAANQTMYYESFFKTGYQSSVKQYPILAELETREDASSALLAHAKQQESGFDYVGLRLSLWMLQLEVYRQNMTFEDAMGYVEMGQVYIWGIELPAMTTSRLARICLDEHFLHTKLSEADSPAAAELIYESIAKKYEPLRELESREDVIETLLYYCDAGSLAVTQRQQKNARALLCLDRFYSRLTDAQQLELAQILSAQ